MAARKLVTDEEHTIGIEDRVFRSGNHWYWQTRGSADAVGPFGRRDQATADYHTDNETLRRPNRILVYWDDQDFDNEGWAYRVSDDDGDIESDALDGLLVTASACELRDAVVDLAAQYGIQVFSGDVAADEHQDGGYAVWTKP